MPANVGGHHDTPGFGFNNYTWEPVITAGQQLKTVTVEGKAEKVAQREEIGLPLKEDEFLRYEFEGPNGAGTHSWGRLGSCAFILVLNVWHKPRWWRLRRWEN